jgi:hypothetical protein
MALMVTAAAAQKAKLAGADEACAAVPLDAFEAHQVEVLTGEAAVAVGPKAGPTLACTAEAAAAAEAEAPEAAMAIAPPRSKHARLMFSECLCKRSAADATAAAAAEAALATAPSEMAPKAMQAWLCTQADVHVSRNTAKVLGRKRKRQESAKRGCASGLVVGRCGVVVGACEFLGKFDVIVRQGWSLPPPGRTFTR